jgi:hypothetical protein
VPLPLLGAALLVLLAFLTTGGNLTGPPTQVPTSWVDVALIVAGGAAVATLVISRTGASSLTLWLFGAVTALTALSIAWSVAPDQTWEESGRTVAYLAAFTVGLVLARRGGGASRDAVVALALSTTALCVWALAVKVLDLNLYTQPIYGRLIAPFAYANATGLLGAMALPGLLWLAARRDTRWAGPLATAGIAIATSVIVLTYSRSAVAAALLATVLPLCFIRARRRAVLMLALGLLGAVPICLYALTSRNLGDDGPKAIDGDGVANLHRVGAGLVLGLIILAVVVILTAAARTLSRRLDAHPQPAGRVKAFDRGLLALVSAVPVLIVLWLLVNSRGPFGEISHLWSKLTSSNAAISDHAGRLFDATNSRSAYWRQALSIGEHHLLAGAGAGTFFPAFLRYSTADLTPIGETAHAAHSYLLETFASFGLIGAALNLGLFLSWCRDSAGAIRTQATAVIPAIDAAELDARWALIGVVIAFGVSSALDWTWFFPGVAVPAITAAGWITGVSHRRRSPAAQLVTAGPARPAVTPVPISARPGAIIALTALLVVTLAVAWESLAPMRSVQSTDASAAAQTAGHGRAALSDAQAAISEDPLSVGARSQLATVYQALSEPSRAHAELLKATQKQADNPQAYFLLGQFLLCSGQDRAAVAPLERANLLDITDLDSQKILLSVARTHGNPGPYCQDYA